MKSGPDFLWYTLGGNGETSYIQKNQHMFVQNWRKQDRTLHFNMIY